MYQKKANAYEKIDPSFVFTLSKNFTSMLLNTTSPPTVLSVLSHVEVG